MRRLVRALLFAVLALVPSLALVDVDINHLRLDTPRLEVAVITAVVGAAVAALLTPPERRPLEVGMLLAMTFSVPVAGSVAMHTVCTAPTSATLPLHATWLLASGATYLLATTFLLAHRRLGFPWWPLALIVAALVAHATVGVQNPCFADA